MRSSRPSPSRSAVSAENPSCSRALLGSPKRWPERSQSRAGASAIGVGLPVSSLISSARSRIVVSTPGGEVVGLARRAARGAGDQAARDVLDKDEVAAGDAAVLDRQRLPMQRLPDKGRGHVAPYGVRRAAPASGAEDLARAVDVLEARPHKRQPVAAEIVIAVHLADQLGDRVRAVVEQRNRRVFGRRARLVEGLLGNRAAGRRHRRPSSASGSPSAQSNSFSDVSVLLSWSASGSWIED